MRVILSVIAAAFLFACTPAGPDTGGSASAEKTIYQVEGDYAAALQVELAYSKLPRCKPASPPVCSQVSVIKKLQSADDVAWAAIKNAQKAVRTPGFGESDITTAVSSASALVKTFISVTSTLKVK